MTNAQFQWVGTARAG